MQSYKGSPTKEDGDSSNEVSDLANMDSSPSQDIDFKNIDWRP